MISYQIKHNQQSILGLALNQSSYSPSDTYNILNNYINEPTDSLLTITTINNLSNSKSTLEKKDDILPIKLQPPTNNNRLVSATSDSDYINKPTTPSTSLIVIQTVNNGQILNIDINTNINSNEYKDCNHNPTIQTIILFLYVLYFFF